MIDLNNITKSFDDNIVISDFSLNIKKGEFVSITGPSGAGKTTVLNIIGLIDKPDQGSVKILNSLNPTKKQIMNLRRNTFGYIFQNYMLMNNETVLENLLLSKRYNDNFTEGMILETMEAVGMDSSFLDKRVYQLSGGEQQRVAISRVMLKPCKIILADEPTGNLDDENKEIIMSLFKSLQSLGKTIVCVTHDKELTNYSDRAINITKNK